jgi:membrane protein required for beta-lactamase induction
MSKALTATGFNFGMETKTSDRTKEKVHDLKDQKVIEFNWVIDSSTISEFASIKQNSYFPKSVFVAKAMYITSGILILAFFVLNISYIFLILSFWLLIVGVGMSKTIKKTTESIIEKSRKL